MRIKRATMLCIFILIYVLPATLFAQNNTVERIGTYDSRIVALAYGRSAEFMNFIGELMAEYEEAEASGDTARVEELNAMGMAIQERLHKQAFSVWPVDDILELVADGLVCVMEEANVTFLVNIWEVEEADGVEYIDVSDQIAQLFDPDTETLSIIEEMKGIAPISLEEISNCGDSCSDCDDCEECE